MALNVLISLIGVLLRNDSFLIVTQEGIKNMNNTGTCDEDGDGERYGFVHSSSLCAGMHTCSGNKY